MEDIDLKKIEIVDLYLNAPVQEVRAYLSENISNSPFSKATFRGFVSGRDFSLMNNRWSKRNIRPTIEGTIAPEGEGTRVQATCALPWWGVYLGRGLLPFSLVFGLIWLTMVFMISGVPESPWTTAGVCLLALVWLPVSSVIISGSMVNEGVNERTQTPILLTDLLKSRFDRSKEQSKAIVKSKAKKKRRKQR